MCVIFSSLAIAHRSSDGASILISRNFDPASRTVKKRTQADNIEDTIEKNVEGMAAMIIAEDEQRRAQELVRVPLLFFVSNHQH